MITLNNKTLCENCFSETTTEPCPHCGFIKSKYRHDPVTLVIGSILDQRYLIGGVIGKGGFGITYLAYDLKLDARIAVKEYYPMGLAMRNPGSIAVTVSNGESVEPFKSGAEKFYNEAKMVAKFNGNPNIVSVHDFFYENDTVYFVMSYLQGQTLKSYLKKKTITEGQAVSVLNQISNALLASHSMNILHRDISPDNIMLCDDGTIRLLDFGAARQVMAEQSQALSVILKQGFAPLEQYQKKGRQGPWTDIYALGATIYIALTGEMLTDPMSRLEDDSEYASNKHGISEKLWKIIYKCTQLKITDRYQDIAGLKEDLEAVGIEAEKFMDIEEEITDLLRGEALDISTGMLPNFAPAADPNATVLLSEPQGGQSNETMAMSPEEAAAYMGAKAPVPQAPPQPMMQRQSSQQMQGGGIPAAAPAPAPIPQRMPVTGGVTGQPMPAQPVTGGVTGRPMPAQPVTGSVTGQSIPVQPVTGGVNGQPMQAQQMVQQGPVQPRGGGLPTAVPAGGVNGAPVARQPQQGQAPFAGGQPGMQPNPGQQPRVMGQQPQSGRQRPPRGKQPYQYQPKVTGKNIKPWSPVLIVILIVLGVLLWITTWGSAIIDIFAMETPAVYEQYAEYQPDDNMPLSDLEA